MTGPYVGGGDEEDDMENDLVRDDGGKDNDDDDNTASGIKGSDELWQVLQLLQATVANNH